MLLGAVLAAAIGTLALTTRPSNAAPADVRTTVEPSHPAGDKATVSWTWQGTDEGKGAVLSLTLLADQQVVAIHLVKAAKAGTEIFDGLGALPARATLSAVGAVAGSGGPPAARLPALFSLTAEVQPESRTVLLDWQSREVFTLARSLDDSDPTCQIVIAGAPTEPPPPTYPATPCERDERTKGTRTVGIDELRPGAYIAELRVGMRGKTITSATSFTVPAGISGTTTTAETRPSLASTSSVPAAAPSATATATARESASAPTAAGGSSPTALLLVGIAVVLGVVVLGGFAVSRRARHNTTDLDPSGVATLPAPGPGGPPDLLPPDLVSMNRANPALVTSPAAGDPLLTPGAPVATDASATSRGSIRIVSDDPAAGDGAGQVSTGERAGRIEPARSQLGTSWGYEGPEMHVAALWLERQIGKGEDAQPSFVFDLDSSTGLLATYDGTGGSGAAPARTTADGHELSGAYVASRLARRTTEEWFAAAIDAHQAEVPPDVQLHGELVDRFAQEGAMSVPSSQKFAGSLRRELPTTLAATVFHTGPEKVSLTALWAGDSRCLVLTPDAGLQQLSVDDTPTRDALDAIITDAPMTNLVCADRPFAINRRNFEFVRPAVLLSATDGCFGYVATPAHFEHLILDSLQRAADATAWAHLALVQLDGFTSDDASLVISAFGWRDFADLQAAFAPRAAFLRAQHWAPFADIHPADRDQFAALRLASWRKYKQHYEEYLPRPQPAEAPMSSSGEDGLR